MKSNKKTTIKIFIVYDACYRGNVGHHSDGFPKGSTIYRTLKKENAQRIVDVMNIVAKKENQLAPIVGEEELVLNKIDIENMSDEEIIKWMKGK